MKSQKLKRCKSLTEIEEDLRGNRSETSRKSNNSTAIRKKSTSKKLYMGRRSLGIHLNTANTGSKIKRKKSKTEIDREIYDDFYGNDVDEGYDDESCYKCIPSITREDNENSEGINGGPENVTNLNLSLKKLDIHQKGYRNALNQRIVQYCQFEKKSIRQLTIVGNNNTFKYGNILWLVLRSHKSANANTDSKHIIVDRNEWLAEDQNIRNTRNKYMHVLDQIIGFRFNTHFVEKTSNKMIFSEEYCKELRKAKIEVENILEDFDSLAELFPTTAVLMKWIEEIKSAKDKFVLDVKLTNLRVWYNTLIDFEKTIESLGSLFSTDSTSNWFKPLNENNTVFSLDAIQDVFRSYVKKTIDLKEMKKVLARIDNLTNVTIAKSSILLQKRPTTYAAATKISNVELQIDDVLKKRYAEMSEYKFGDKIATALNLPNLSTLFNFILIIPMQLVVCWLNIRTNSGLQDYSVLDALTFDAMITDTKECLDEAIKTNRKYFGLLNSIGPIPVFMYPEDYEVYVHEVFQKYIQYVKSWANCKSVQADPVHLFVKLEEEWRCGLKFAKSTKRGMEILSCACFDILNNLVEDFVETYTEDELERLKNEFIENPDDSDDNDNLETTESLHNNFKQNINFLIKEVKERELRIFSFIRSVLNDIYDSNGYSLNDFMNKWQDIIEEIKEDYYLIEFITYSEFDSIPIAIFVNNSIASNSKHLDECILNISNSIKIDDGCVIIVPDSDNYIKNSWKDRRARIEIDQSTCIHFSNYLRNDVVLLFGCYNNLSKSNIFENLKIDAQFCYSNDIVSSRIRELCENRLLTHLDKQLEKIKSLLMKCADFGKHFHFKLEQQFLIAFQIHRDVSKVIGDTFISELGQTMIQRAINLMESYLKFVDIKNAKPSKHFPMWASPAFLFLQYFSEPRWVSESVMNSKQYEKMEKFVDILENKIMGTNGNGELIQVSYQRMTRSTSSKYSTISNESKRETQMEKIEQIEKKRDDKYLKNKQIGRVLGDDKTGFEIIGLRDKTRKAPFQWITLQEIGDGKFGTVCRALDIDNHKTMAVKIIEIGKTKDTSVIESEINIFRNLHHENLVQYYDYEIREKEVFIFMELCSSGTLTTICHGNMNLDLVRKLTHSLLKAVRYLHFTKNVIHRDIKPDNIFLDNKTVLKLGDFGCSAKLQNDSTIYGEFQTFVGTQNYMAPEIFTYGNSDDDGNYEGYGRSIDIWAVGCTVIEMMTGSRPWKDLEVMRIMWQICQMKQRPKYPQIAQERQDVKEFLDMCFSFDPRDRADAKQLLNTTFANVNLDNMQELAESSNYDSTPRISLEGSTNSFQKL
ncbi:unnamed protein product [Caenorhabditis angaria]|uniref:Protein kinase domain-containing protein n=1 Tax=Caenorhabditis angaria TaxID=860376 RepID=A0A9P1I5S0_9PELO|nr:unnamed protein product [Caenorhabditis angaria]